MKIALVGVALPVFVIYGVGKVGICLRSLLLGFVNSCVIQKRRVMITTVLFWVMPYRCLFCTSTEVTRQFEQK